MIGRPCKELKRRDLNTLFVSEQEAIDYLSVYTNPSTSDPPAFNEDGCWMTFTPTTEDGYVQLDVPRFLDPDRKKCAILLHRLVYLVHHGRVDIKLEISHLCANPRCININHLVEETQEENNARKKCTGKSDCQHLPQCVPSSSHGVPKKDKQYKLPKEVIPKSRSQPLRVKIAVNQPLAQPKLKFKKLAQRRKKVIAVVALPRVKQKNLKNSENFAPRRRFAILSNDSDDDDFPF